MFRHDLLQGLQARHARHFHIHRDHIWLQLLHLLNGFFPVPRDTHHLNLFAFFQHGGQAFSHEGGIVHDQDANLEVS